MKIFEIIGTIAIVLFVLIGVLILYFLNKGLKAVNKFLGEGRGVVKKDLGVSLDGLSQAQGQIEAVSAITGAVKSGMQQAVAGADRMVAFVKSSSFQTGVPIAVCFMIGFAALPRALFPRRKKRKGAPIPPPSLEKKSA